MRAALCEVSMLTSGMAPTRAIGLGRRAVRAFCAAAQQHAVVRRPTLYPLVDPATFDKYADDTCFRKDYAQFGNKLDEMIDKAHVYMRGNKIVDREPLMAQLRVAMSKANTCGLVVGTKSCGKSKILKALVAEQVAKRAAAIEKESRAASVRLPPPDPAGVCLKPILYVNLRSAINKSHIAAAVAEQVCNEQCTDVGGFKNLLSAFADPVLKLATPTLGLDAKTVGYAAAAAAAAAAAPAIAKAWAELSPKDVMEKTRQHYGAIVVDEANEAFDASDPECKRQWLQFVFASKEENTMPVLLVSSEYGFPYKLHRAGFNRADFGLHIAAGEADFEAMKDMMTSEWSVPDELADHLVAVFGGHVAFAVRALERMRDMGPDFRADAVRDIGGLGECVDHPGAREHLVNIAKHGFSPVKKPMDDEGAELISKVDLGGVYPRAAEGLWPEATGSKYVLVAGSHHHRYRVWRELKENKIELA